MENLQEEEHTEINHETNDACYEIKLSGLPQKVKIYINEKIKNSNDSNSYQKDYSLEQLQEKNIYFQKFEDIKKAYLAISKFLTSKKFSIKKEEENNIMLVITFFDEFGDKNDVILNVAKNKKITIQINQIEEKIDENFKEMNLKITDKIDLKINELGDIFNKKINEIYNKFNEFDLKIDKKIDEKIDTKLQNILQENKELNCKMNEILNILTKKNPLNDNTINQLNNPFNKDPNLLKIKATIINNTNNFNYIPHLFTVFRSINNLDIIAYSTNDNSISFYDISHDEIIHTIYKPHNDYIYCVKYFLDKINNQELIVSTSWDKLIKIWDISNNYTCILTIREENYLNTSEIVFKDNKRYIVSLPYNKNIKIYNFDGNIYKDFGIESQRKTYYSYIYYTSNQIYIITGNDNYNNSSSSSFNFETSCLYHNYSGNQNTWSEGAKVIKKNSEDIIIVAYGNGKLELFYFNTGIFISVIKGDGSALRCIMIWNDKYLVSGGEDGNIKLFDYINYKFIGNIQKHGDKVNSIQKYENNKYGEFLITQCKDGTIKILT